MQSSFNFKVSIRRSQERQKVHYLKTQFWNLMKTLTKIDILTWFPKSWLWDQFAEGSELPDTQLLSHLVVVALCIIGISHLVPLCMIKAIVLTVFLAGLRIDLYLFPSNNIILWWSGVHKSFQPTSRAGSTWSKFGARGEHGVRGEDGKHGDVFRFSAEVFSNLGVLQLSENHALVLGEPCSCFLENYALVLGEPCSGPRLGWLDH